MDAASFTTPAFMTLPDSLSSPDYSTPEPTTIKMEDLQKPQLPLSPPPESHKSHADDMSSTPSEMGSPSSHSDAKTTKKRKSWGQVLPEPKTSLPPRKRAKTEDEKEQRRIERVKRNRLAAHNSRERKRQEVELLLDEKKLLEDRVRELEAVVRGYQQAAPHLKSEDFKLEPETPQPSASSTTPSHIDDSASSAMVDPKTTSFTSMTPSTSPSLRSIDTPSYSESMPATPVEFQEATVALSDETQHSAAVLCDQQCPSVLANRQPSLERTRAFQSAILSLIMLSLQLQTPKILSLSSSISLIQRTMMTWIFSTIKTTTRTPSWSTPSQATAPWTVLMALKEIWDCTPTQAQQLLLATRLAPQIQFDFKTVGMSSAARGFRDDGDARRTLKVRRRIKAGGGRYKRCLLRQSSEITGVRLKRAAS